MKINFIEQDYQKECVNNIIDIFRDYDLKNPNKEIYHKLLEKNIKSNVPKVGISSNLNLDIMMETGTGKTFTYIQTIHELFKNYGVNKFVLLVPSVGIREGSKKNFEITKDFFFTKYQKYINLHTYEKGEKSINNVKNFINADESTISVLLLTPSSFDKKDNILNRFREGFSSDNEAIQGISNKDKTPMKYISLLNPFIIIDEPHKFKGDKFLEIFKDHFSNCHYLRFGATFPKDEYKTEGRGENRKKLLDKELKLSNMPYSLDSINSFKNYLVKKIIVHTNIANENTFLLSKILKNSNKNGEGKIEILFNGNKQEITQGEDIGVKLDLDNYKGVFLGIVKSGQCILSNGEIIDNTYTLTNVEIEQQISHTIDLHFKKEEENFKQKVKTLSLFFISGIEQYRNNGRIKVLFEKLYKEKRKEILKSKISKKYKEYLEKDFDSENTLRVNEGYFSGDKGNGDEKIKKGVDDILKNKESLLSFDNSLRFVFSVWALQEGWDNPNVFNICKLSNYGTETSKLQQVGRGLRIAVNQKGERLIRDKFDTEKEFYNINTLDVIVSEKEKGFIEGIQNEIVENSFIIIKSFTEEEFKEKLERNIEDINRNKLGKLLFKLEEEEILNYENSTINKYTFVNEDYISDLKSDNIKNYCINKLEFTEEQYNSFIKTFDVSETLNNRISKADNYKQNIKIKEKNLDDFKNLWELINRKSKIVYEKIDNDKKLLSAIIDEVNKKDIDTINSKIETKELKEEKIVNEIESKSKKIEFKIDINNYAIELSKETKFPLQKVLYILNNIEKSEEKLKTNPLQLKKIIQNSIVYNLENRLLNITGYNFENETRISNSLQNNDGSYKKELPAGVLGKEQEIITENYTIADSWLYENVIEWDSKIEKELIKNHINSEENKITVFAKLPKISIPTPFKTYNPDFAYVVTTKKGKQLFLVVETKGYNDENDISGKERLKIKYAKRFFEKLNGKLKNDNIEIHYKQYLNKNNINDIIKGIINE